MNLNLLRIKMNRIMMYGKCHTESHKQKSVFYEAFPILKPETQGA